MSITSSKVENEAVRYCLQLPSEAELAREMTEELRREQALIARSKPL